MEKIITIMLLTLISISFGKDLQDVVKLKNGSIIRGIVIKQIPSQSLSIRTIDGSIFVYQMDDVVEISKDEAPAKMIEPGFDGNNNRYTLVNLLYSYSIGTDSKDTYMIGLKAVGGKLITDNFGIGIGCGINRMEVTAEASGNINYIPLFADIRMNLTKDKKTSYLFLDPGLSFIASSTGIFKYTGGMYFNGGIGVRSKLDQSTDFDLSFSYMLQKTKCEFEYIDKIYNPTTGDYLYIQSHAQGELEASYITVMLGIYF